MDLTLNSMGVNHITIQEGFLKWLVKKSASRLMQENAESSISDILEILEKCLPFIGDLSFSSLWIVLLDKIATLSYGTEMLHLYEKIDQEILSMILKGEQAPLPVLLHLWQTNLPSLEFMVINILQQMTLLSSSDTHNSLSSREILDKSLLIQASSHEPLICSTVHHMLNSLKDFSPLQPAVTDVLNIISGEILRKPTLSVEVYKTI